MKCIGWWDSFNECLYHREALVLAREAKAGGNNVEPAYVGVDPFVIAVGEGMATADGSDLVVFTGAGMWLVEKYREQAERLGVRQAAKNLRKQGCPVEVAVAILCVRKLHTFPDNPIIPVCDAEFDFTH